MLTNYILGFAILGGFPNFTYRNLIELQLDFLKTFKSTVPPKMFYTEVIDLLDMQNS